MKVILGNGMRMTVLGLVIGFRCSLGPDPQDQSQLFEVRAADPLAFVAVATLLIKVAFIAGWFPVRCATRVDSSVALRSE